MKKILFKLLYIYSLGYIGASFAYYGYLYGKVGVFGIKMTLLEVMAYLPVIIYLIASRHYCSHN